MQLGVYVDAFNLYYGAKGICHARNSSGWKWLDIRALAKRLIGMRLDPSWQKAEIVRVVYCTAMVSGREDPTSPRDQERYLRTLEATNSVDVVEQGNYIEKVVTRPRATPGRNGKPLILSPREWVSVADREEKASDVNVATHLLMDMMEGRISGAIVISNDSDLRLPLRKARDRIPTATINPSRNQLAGHLRGNATDGVGGHWWYQLVEADIRGSQLPNPAANFLKPIDW